MGGTNFAEQAARYLIRPRSKPFYLVVSFYEPHSPFRYPVEYRNRHDPAKFSVPKLGPEDAGQVPVVFRELSDGEKQGIIAAYYTSVEFMDKNVGLVPTIYELCGYQVTLPLQGRSLQPLLRGKTGKHRDHVIVEYAPNEEVMIGDKDWKLIYERGVERRTDGYDTGAPLVPNKFRLYDMFRDPGELKNVADEKAHAAVVKRLTDLLVDHLAKTSRLQELIPTSTDPLTVLEFGVQSRDVPQKRD